MGYLRQDPDTGEVTFHEGEDPNMGDPALGGKHTRGGVGNFMQILDPRKSALPYVLPYAMWAGGAGGAAGSLSDLAQGGNEIGLGTGVGLGGDVPSLGVNVGNSLLPGSLATSTAVPLGTLPAAGSSAAALTAGSAPQALGAAPTTALKFAKGASAAGEAGMGLKKIAALTALQAGLGALGGALSPQPQVKQSFEGTPGVGPREAARTAQGAAINLGIGMAKQPAVGMRQPVTNVPGIPFGIGPTEGSPVSPLDTGGFLEWLNKQKSSGGF